MGNNPVLGFARNKKNRFQEEKMTEEEGVRKEKGIDFKFKLASSKKNCLLKNYIKNLWHSNKSKNKN